MKSEEGDATVFWSWKESMHDLWRREREWSDEAGKRSPMEHWTRQAEPIRGSASLWVGDLFSRVKRDRAKREWVGTCLDEAALLDESLHGLAGRECFD